MNNREIVAFMPGKVIDIKIQEGDSVKPGDVLFTFESMKMENEMTSDTGGVVKKILVSIDDIINPGSTVAIIQV